MHVPLPYIESTTSPETAMQTICHDERDREKEKYKGLNAQ